MKGTVSRRRALQACGIVVGGGLAGCLSDGSEDPTTGDPESTQGDGATELALGETVSVSRGSITVESMTTHRMVEVLFGSAHSVVHGKRDTQFVVTELTTEGITDPVELAREEMALDLGSERYEVTEEHLSANVNTDGTVRLAFPIPMNISETAGTLLWTNDSGKPVASWAVVDRVSERLSNPPAFRVESFEVPETATVDSTISVAVEVRNTGDSSGTFLAELGTKRLSDQPQDGIDIPAGEIRIKNGEMRLVGDAGETETVVLDWGMDKLEHEVTIES